MQLRQAIASRGRAPARPPVRPTRALGRRSSRGHVPLLLASGFLIGGIGLRAAEATTASSVCLALAVAVLLCLLATAWSSPGAFLGFWVWIHLEDLVRLVTGSFAVFFVKDILLAALVVGWWLDRRRRRSVLTKNPIGWPLLFYGLMVFVQCFNPEIADPLVPLVGVHAKLLYVPLLFISMAYFDSAQKIRQFLVFMMLAVALESALALIQYFRDPAWWYTTMKISQEAEVVGYRNSIGGSLLRTGSIFNNPGRFSQFVVIISIVLLGAQTVFRGRPALFWLWGASVPLVFAGGVFLQSARTVVYLFFLAMVLVFFVHGRFDRTKLTGLALAGLVFIGMHWIDTHVDPRIKYHYLTPVDLAAEEHDSIGGRFKRGLLQIEGGFDAGGLLGNGTGSSSQGLQYVIGSKAIPRENGYAALLWEFGPLGPLLWLSLMGTLLARGWRSYRALKGTVYSKLAFSLVVMIASAFVLQYVGLQYLENYLVVTHFWAFAGLLFALERMVRIERQNRDDHAYANS